MKNKQSVRSSGMGLGTIIFLIFLVLKLAGIGVVATWSWIWIFSPLWIPAAIFIGLGIFALILALILSLFSK